MESADELLKELLKCTDEYLEATEDFYMLQQVISDLTKSGQSLGTSFGAEFDEAKKRVEETLNKMREVQSKLTKLSDK